MGDRKIWKKRLLLFLSVMLLVTLFPLPGSGARLKDVASIGGIRDNQLIGYGLVVGLAGTGDDMKNGFTRESLSNMLSRQGLAMKDKLLKSDNVAAVMVTAMLPPFAKGGTKIDVTVSSIGDATSLQGGTLLLTPLMGVDGEIYAVAQGPLVLGGFSAGGVGTSVSKNFTSVARIPNGAFVEKELHYDLENAKEFCINLFQPDFTTLTRVSQVIRSAVEGVSVEQKDSGSVAVKLEEGFPGNPVDLLARIENLEVSLDTPAVIVMNEKTGTVVMGENVRISTVAVAHGNLSIQIREEQNVSQPLPFAPGGGGSAGPVMDPRTGTIVAPGGQTVVTTEKTVGVGEEKKQLLVVEKGVTIQDVVRALNAIGVTPRDLITILQTIKAAGALQADLVVL
jgi:flagellar P-ring protein precursor FlgI